VVRQKLARALLARARELRAPVWMQRFKGLELAAGLQLALV